MTKPELPVPIPPDPKPAHRNGTYSLFVTVVAIIGIAYYLIFGFKLPDLGGNSPGRPRPAGAEVITWPGCKYQGGYSEKVTATTLLCKNGAVVTVR